MKEHVAEALFQGIYTVQSLPYFKSVLDKTAGFSL